MARKMIEIKNQSAGAHFTLKELADWTQDALREGFPPETEIYTTDHEGRYSYTPACLTLETSQQ